ncbi:MULTISPECIES: histidine kinase dimerization/phospho-acceptor domain-containing protein [unclassified Pseudoalteromonas]|uniref:histidine kinase dimerization/phospho-acceptor domain-containing protein n=1 Tax=unclassified Pseudoalteromonas TaxID=194690 RepID=UPI000C08A68B|nr:MULTISPECIES: histidine kinase dimerization/phospho-acceptor domain-containing protein [unclassified Pseudoalteromonas]MDP2635592.1 histidine kinase dimerization/phospho-acceptor domain-containing protein [Pseudoalteromonas sp. 1_MG-2023]PHN88913.1 hypothetical protein CSC79_15610 [Pseudoalteromonas sp. 3D05]
MTLEYINDASKYYPDKAESYIEAALEIVAEGSSDKTQLLTHYARAKFYKSEFSQAEALFEEALRRALESKNNNNLMLIYAYYSMQANELRNFDKSLQLIGDGLAIAQQKKINQRNIAIVFSLLIFVLVGFFYYRYTQRKKLEDKRIALMQIKAKEQDLIELNKNLENIVATRTESLTRTNQTLESTLLELKSTQDNLIEVEKMASLSKLVAGVAHEVNTPLGTIITAVSFLKEELASFKHMVIENKVSKVGLDSFLESITQSSELIEKNTSRSANLINGLKQVAAQKRADPPQAFVLKDCIDKVMVSILKNPCFKCISSDLI